MIESNPALPPTPHLTEQELNDLLDGRVPRDDRMRLEEHLDACDRCRTLHDDLRSLLALARASRHTAVPPEELWSLVSACTVHERVVRRQLVRSARTPIAGMALVVATLSATAGAVAARSPRRDVASEASTERSSDAPLIAAPHEPAPAGPPASDVPGQESATGASSRAPSTTEPPAAAPHATDSPALGAPVVHSPPSDSPAAESPVVPSHATESREAPSPHAALSDNEPLVSEPIPSDVEALRARAAAIDVRIRAAVREAAGKPVESPAYARLADLYATRRTVMEAIRTARK